MRKWWVDFSGYCIVDADTREEVEETFFKHIYPATESPIHNEIYEVTGIEMIEPEVKQLNMFDKEYGH